MKDLEKKLRSWVWHRLVFLADRISPEDAFRATGLRIHLKKGVGWVLDDKGVQIWYKGMKEYNEHSHDGYDDGPVITESSFSTGPGGITISSNMSGEEVQRIVSNATYWGLTSR